MSSKIFRRFFKAAIFTSMIFLTGTFISCSQTTGTVLPEAYSKKFKETQEQLKNLLEEEENPEIRFTIMKTIAGNLQAVHDYPSLILFLTDWVDNNPDDQYNSYWLVQTAYAYLQCSSEPMAQYYFERCLRNYGDLTVQGQSIHELCLKHLLQITTDPANRISYFNLLITRFPESASTTELYIRMAQEYEKEGEWAQSLRCYQQFLAREDATTIQIPGIPNAFKTAKRLIDFNNSSKSWTYETLDELVGDVKAALRNGNVAWLETIRSKVNFFAMSWKTDENSDNAQSGLNLSAYMFEKSINYSPELDEMSTPSEAYLRTWGWNTSPNIWYLYFRKVNFPADQNIHGRWEWAGVYFGDKL
ncbi:MAG: tetratricopeptide repeat protein [Treponema sp.]|nr:tetratricopeptide repeat protein [Treponema sp.]